MFGAQHPPVTMATKSDNQPKSWISLSSGALPLWIVYAHARMATKHAKGKVFRTGLKCALHRVTVKVNSRGWPPLFRWRTKGRRKEKVLTTSSTACTPHSQDTALSCTLICATLTDWYCVNTWTHTIQSWRIPWCSSTQLYTCDCLRCGRTRTDACYSCINWILSCNTRWTGWWWCRTSSWEKKMAYWI